jgi:PleD family two-component response regulator
VTASFGVTGARKTDTIESIFERVDEALYKAKKSGKNCVIPV